MHWAVKGVKCVCVDGEWTPQGTVPGTGRFFAPLLPLKGHLYTVDGVEDHMVYGLCIRLVEIPPAAHGPSWWWTVDHFRPLTERTQEQDLRRFVPLLKAAKILALTKELLP